MVSGLFGAKGPQAALGLPNCSGLPDLLPSEPQTPLDNGKENGNCYLRFSVADEVDRTQFGV